MVTFIISKIVVAVKMTNIFIFESFIVFMILLIVYLFRAALSSIVFFVDDGDFYELVWCDPQLVGVCRMKNVKSESKFY